MEPIFTDEPHETRRIRHAACLLAGTGWTANPGMRALPAEDMALYGSWVGVTAADRAMLAQALHVGLGGDPASSPALLARLASAEQLIRAGAWGLAIRLAQRLGGGAPRVLAALPLTLAEDGAVVPTVPRTEATLADSGAERRLARLGLALDRQARIESRPDPAFAPANSGKGGGRRRHAAA
jgi:exopolyphosphatase/guanosine-5'-triphosphate,3'-diphosphate pyrophosphatase